MGGVLSFNSVKMLGCVVALPLLLAIALKIQPGTGGQVIFWLLGAALTVGIFIFMNAVLVDRGQPWTFMLPGSFMLGAAAFIVIVIALLTGGNQNTPTALLIAIMLAGFAGAAWYNIRGLGLGDGIVITLMQACLALLVVGVVVGWQFFVPHGNRRR